jgi:hypothetical protein
MPRGAGVYPQPSRMAVPIYQRSTRAGAEQAPIPLSHVIQSRMHLLARTAIIHAGTESN